MAATQGLHVGAASERGLDPEQDLAGPWSGHGHLFEAQVAWPVKHLSTHPGRHGVM
jgi:hypothetical protein